MVVVVVEWASCNKTSQPGVSRSLLYNGSRFTGHQKSKGNQYDVEVMLQHVDEDAAYLCGYLKIKNLTDEYPEMVTFFDGEIISDKHPFLTRKWDADEDVDKKHWVETEALRNSIFQLLFLRESSCPSVSTVNISTRTASTMKN